MHSRSIHRLTTNAEIDDDEQAYSKIHMEIFGNSIYLDTMTWSTVCRLKLITLSIIKYTVTVLMSDVVKDLRSEDKDKDLMLEDKDLKTRTRT